MNKDRYVIGVDFGTDSVRSVIVNAVNGKEESSHVSYYKRWMEGKYNDPAKNQFRQHPLDHIESLEESITIALEKVPKSTIFRGDLPLTPINTSSSPFFYQKV